MKLRHLPVVPNPIDLDLFRPSEKHSQDTLRSCIWEGLNLQGVHTLIRAFGYVQQHLPKVKLTLLGMIAMKNYVLHKVSQLRYPENVQFINQLPREKLVEYYQRSTVCVVPSIWENYPYVCLEAMGCGRPVVASRVGGLTDMIDHGINGILVPPASSKELGEALVNLLNDRELRETLGRNARLTIEEKYAPAKIAEKTLSVYQKVRGH